MFSPLTRVLIKIFAYGFFKVHAGLLLALFVSLIIYFFFIEVLNQTHLPPDQIILYNLALVLEFVRNPIMMGIVFSLWLLYTIKSWKYVAGQLIAVDHQFLLYSSTSLGRVKQFISWFTLQFVILLPVIVFGLFACIIGVMYKHYIIPAIIPLYVLLLTCLSAYLYVGIVNRLPGKDSDYMFFTWISKWPKPLFSLFLYHIFDKLKLTYGITKVISWLIIACMYRLFAGQQQDLRIEGIVVVGIITDHSLLIYHSHEFEKNYLSFMRTFPYSRFRLFIHMAGLYFFLLLPESIWFVSKYDYSTGIGLILIGLGIALLLRSSLYVFTLPMNKYMQVVFALFMLCLILILYGVVWALIPLVLLISCIIFFRHYYALTD